MRGEARRARRPGRGSRSARSGRGLGRDRGGSVARPGLHGEGPENPCAENNRGRAREIAKKRGSGPAAARARADREGSESARERHARAEIN